MKAEDVFGGIAAVVNRHPKGVLAVMTVLAIIAVGFMTAIPSQTMSDEYMDKQSPAGIVYNLYNNRYGQDTYILLIKAPDPADPELLNQLLLLEKQIGRTDHVSSVSSIADVVAANHGGTIPGTTAEVQAIINLLPPIHRQSMYLTGRPYWPMSSSTRVYPPTLRRISSRSWWLPSTRQPSRPGCQSN
jgi:Predicted exporters of the RND superfamily